VNDPGWTLLRLSLEGLWIQTERRVPDDIYYILRSFDQAGLRRKITENTFLKSGVVSDYISLKKT